jgi:hypothetical protein
MLNFDTVTRLNENNLIDSASIIDRSGTSDGMGGIIGPYVDTIIDLDIPCRYSTISGKELIIGEQFDPKTDGVVVFNKDYSIEDNKHIRINEVMFKILYVEPQSTFSAMQRVFVRRID